jgi:hypothetical protein
LDLKGPPKIGHPLLDAEAPEAAVPAHFNVNAAGSKPTPSFYKLIMTSGLLPVKHPRTRSARACLTTLASSSQVLQMSIARSLSPQGLFEVIADIFNKK